MPTRQEVLIRARDRLELRFTQNIEDEMYCSICYAKSSRQRSLNHKSSCWIKEHIDILNEIVKEFDGKAQVKQEDTVAREQVVPEILKTTPKQEHQTVQVEAKAEVEAESKPKAKPKTKAKPKAPITIEEVKTEEISQEVELEQIKLADSQEISEEQIIEPLLEETLQEEIPEEVAPIFESIEETINEPISMQLEPTEEAMEKETTIESAVAVLEAIEGLVDGLAEKPELVKEDTEKSVLVSARRPKSKSRKSPKKKVPEPTNSMNSDSLSE
jgi:hypothetical protein